MNYTYEENCFLLIAGLAVVLMVLALGAYLCDWLEQRYGRKLPRWLRWWEDLLP